MSDSHLIFLDDAELLSGARDGQRLRFLGHSDIIAAIEFTPAGDRIVTGSRPSSEPLHEASAEFTLTAAPESSP